MAELPLLPQQQRTTTHYNPIPPYHRPAAFRPKLRFANMANTSTTTTTTTDTINASPCTSLKVEEEAEMKEQQEQELPVPVTATETPVVPRALYWLLYTEKQERQLLYRSYLEASPQLQCGTDADLTAIVENGFERREQRLISRVLHRQQLEADEAVERWRNVEEPWERGCHKLRLVQEMLEGKLWIWDTFRQQLNLRWQLLQLITEEKRARLNVLAFFISCKSPLPCRCLLWDMEVLEGSAIPLEPAVNLPCVYVSILTGECDVLHRALLAQRERDLAIMKAQLINCMEAYEVLRNIELDEQERFETLMGYHAFCMKIAKQKRELKHGERSEQEEGGGEVKQLKSYPLERYVGTRWSPYIDFFRYLHLVKTSSLEETFRCEIEKFEGVEACFLMHVYQTVCRLTVATEEETARQALLIEMENWERNALKIEESRSLWGEIRPDAFLRIARSMMQHLEESRARQLEAYRITILLQLLVEYEHQRRGALLLLEKKLHTERRLFFFSHLCVDGERRVVERWMLHHELLVVTREEERLRLRIERQEAEAIATPATAHEWMVEYTNEARRKVQVKEIKHKSIALLEEYKRDCREMELEWVQERSTLFEKKLSIPISREESTISTMTRNRCGEDSVHELDIRRLMISDLADFLDNDVLLTIFALP